MSPQWREVVKALVRLYRAYSRHGINSDEVFTALAMLMEAYDNWLN